MIGLPLMLCVWGAALVAASFKDGLPPYPAGMMMAIGIIAVLAGAVLFGFAIGRQP